MKLLKQVAARFPHLQSELKRLHYAWQIRQGTFISPEPEFAILSTLVHGGLVIDVGANVGHYAKRFSELADWVIAFEPVPETCALLTANTRLFRRQNVFTMMAAVSDKTGLSGMEIPVEDGIPNFYLSQLSPEASLKVMTLRLDDLGLPKVSLVKLDVEGHEQEALNGMQGILERDRPVLIVETGSKEVVQDLKWLGYACERLEGSPNLLCKPETK